MPKKPAHSFGLQSPHDMLSKLDRELGRLVASITEPQNVVDHTINCCVTAWHMVDWVWQLHLRNNHAAQQELAARANVPLPEEIRDSTYVPRWTKEAFSKLCGGLRLCEDVAIGAKHVFPEHRPPTATETEVTARIAQAFTLDWSTLGGGDVLAAENGSVPPQYLPEITSGLHGMRQNAIEVLDSVVMFWRGYLADLESERTAD